jgi:hypothetical protein
VRVVPLSDPALTLRAYAVTRRGRSRWAPVAAVLDLLGGDPAGVTRARTGQAEGSTRHNERDTAQ